MSPPFAPADALHAQVARARVAEPDSDERRDTERRCVKMAAVGPRDRLRVAACQMTATENRDHNRAVAGLR